MTNDDPADRATPSAEQLTMLAEALDAVPSAIAVWDHELRNVFANRAYIDWLRVPPEQVRGQHAKDLLEPEVYELSLPYMLGALDGESQVFERVMHEPAGEDRETQVEYTPYAVDGKIIGFVAIVIDVSVRIRAERDARVAAERLATLTERQRIEQRAHEGILQDLFAVQLNIERAHSDIDSDSPAAPALELALDRLDAAVADLRLVLGIDTTEPPGGDGGTAARLSAAARC